MSMPWRILVVPVAFICLTSPSAIATEDLPEVKPPVGENHVVTQAQLRYCMFQKLRIDGAKKALEGEKIAILKSEQGKQEPPTAAQIRAFNAALDDWNNRCTK